MDTVSGDHLHRLFQGRQEINRGVSTDVALHALLLHSCAKVFRIRVVISP